MTGKTFDIAAIGELLIDFTPLKAEPGKAVFERNPGGAPANVLVAAQRLGMKTALISKVGDDIFGRFLKDTAEAAGVDVGGVIVSDDYPTTLAFVSLDDSGDRSFEFYRKRSADVMLSRADLDEELLRSCRVLHFGSVSLTDEPSRSATLEAVCIAADAGALISYDPNFRPPLWREGEDAVSVLRMALQYADIVKVSDNELELLTGESDCRRGAQRLVDGGANFVFVTLGPQGCYYACSGGECGSVPGYRVNTVDTTGAGDCFTGSMLTGLVSCGFAPAAGELEQIVRFANAAAALSTTARGAIPAMPDRASVERMMRLK